MRIPRTIGGKIRPVVLLIALIGLIPTASLAERDDGGDVEQITKPEIVRISPGKAEPGMIVAIELSGFSDDAYDDPLTVRFDGIEATVQSQEPGQLTVTVPPSLKTLNANPTILVISRKFPDLQASLTDQMSIVFPEIPPDTRQSTIEGADSPGLAWFQSWQVTALLLGITVTIAYLFGSSRRETSGSLKGEGATQPSGLPGVKPVELDLPEPTIPDDMVQLLIQGEVVAHIGAGVGAQSGLPTWNALIAELLHELKERGYFDPVQALSIQSVLRSGHAQFAAEAISQALRKDHGPIIDSLSAIFSRIEAKPSEVHKLLARLPCSAWLSSGFDTLFERALSKNSKTDHLEVFTPDEAEKSLDALSREEPFLFKLYGSIAAIAPVTLGVQQFVDSVRNNSAFEELLDKVFLTRTLFFVGTSLQGIEEFMRGIQVRSIATRRHYALVVVEDESWELKASFLAERFGIQVLPIAKGQEKKGIAEFLRKLSEHATKELNKVARGETDYSNRRQSWLSEIRVSNIGPFDELSLKLDRQWNLLLGDNGVGKSTILKAIGVALCGEESNLFAERIVNRSSTWSEISLKAGGETYATTLRRRSRGGVEIESVGGRAMDKQGWLALGFPALRTISWARPRSEGSLGARRPTAADVLPILSDDPDPRLDGLKQRIVTLDHLQKKEQIEKSGSRGHSRLMEDFFSIFDDITEGMNVRFKAIDPETREITIETEDGEVPIESLSQGTISLISWVGVLLQRLYEVTPDDEDPKDRYVIVMIDEIDAHMHPAWQTTIVSTLSRIFPKAQFIATTHSPLVVRGLKVSQVNRFKRNDEGKVEVLDVPEDMLMGRSDQVLAGSLFDVDADLDVITEEFIDDYQELLGKSNRSDEEEKEFRELENTLEYRIPVPVTSPPDRRAQELLTALLKEQVAPQDQKISEIVMHRAKQLFDELQNQHQASSKRKGKSS